MKLNLNEGRAGVMTLKDGTQMNYGVIRVTQNSSKIIFYAEKGLRVMFKLDMTDEEKVIGELLKKLDEQTLMKSGHISEMALANIHSTN